MSDVYGSLKRQNACYTWNKHWEGELGGHTIFNYFCWPIIVLGDLRHAHVSAADLWGDARGSPEIPAKVHFAASARRRGCWLAPALTNSGRWGITKLSAGHKSPLFSCRQNRQHIALASLNNGLSCLFFKLVLRQEYLTACLGALPVFKLPLVISDHMCLCEGGSY